VLFRPVTREAQGEAKSPLEKFSPSLAKCVGHSLKLLDTVQKFLAPLTKFSPLLVSQAGYGPGSIAPRYMRDTRGFSRGEADTKLCFILSFRFSRYKRSKPTVFQHFILTNGGKHYVCRCSIAEGDEQSFVIQS